MIAELLRESDLNLVSIAHTSERNYPLHLWRTLAQTREARYLDVLFDLLVDEKHEEASWFRTEFPLITSAGPLSHSLKNTSLDVVPH